MSLPDGWGVVEVEPLVGVPPGEGEGTPKESPREMLRTTHREILRRVFLGEELKSVAAQVGMRYDTIKFITRSPIFQAALAEMQREADAKVVDTAGRLRLEKELVKAAEDGIPIAVKAMKDEIRTGPGTRAKIAFGFLDRIGLGPTRKVEESRDGFREMLERLDQMEGKTSPGTTVEAEIRFSVRKEGGYDDRAGVSPAPETISQSTDGSGAAEPSSGGGTFGYVHGRRVYRPGEGFLTEALGGSG